MTQSEYEAELHFRLCKSIFATLAIRGIIGEDDLRILLLSLIHISDAMIIYHIRFQT